MSEGGKGLCVSFRIAKALYGHGEPSLIPGIRPISPLDVLDNHFNAPQRWRVYSPTLGRS
jgi:hypothetical protein